MLELDAEKIQTLIHERAQRSQLYKRLGESQRVTFEGAVYKYAAKVIQNVPVLEIRHRWRSAGYNSGAEDVLTEMSHTLAGEFGLKPGSFNAAIRNSARDVLLVTADPKAHGDIASLLHIRQTARRMHSDEVRPGRQHATRETQPPSTGARSLRRRRK